VLSPLVTPFSPVLC